MYDNYSNTLNIVKRQLETYGTPIEFHRYAINDYNEFDYDEELKSFSTIGLYHAGSGKMDSSSAIRFAYTSAAGQGLGQMSDTGVLILYDSDNLPQTGDICYLQNYKFYVQVITDILSVHKVLDIALQVVGIMSP